MPTTLGPFTGRHANRNLLSFLTIVAAIMGLSTATAEPGPGTRGQIPHSTQSRPQLSSVYGKIPMAFEANVGQTDRDVRFLSRGPGYTLFLTSNEAVWRLADKESHTADRPGAAVLRMKLIASAPNARIIGVDELPGKSNYLMGNPTNWKRNVPTYAGVRYESIYPGVNLHYYSHQGQVEYDFLVAPGASPDSIQFSLDGVENARLDKAGDLLLTVGPGAVRMKRPIAYQEVSGEREPVSAEFVLTAKNRVGFRIGPHDPAKLLVIDPVVVYSTYLGGASSNEYGSSIAVDSFGDTYVTGYTFGAGFPAVSGFDSTANGLGDAFVLKLNADGSAVVFSTYLGGSNDDGGRGIAVDSLGNVIVSGVTSSSDFPVLNAAQATNAGSSDAFVAKLNPTGSALIYSTYLGGSNGDGAQRVAVDSSGNAYVTGSAVSANFPTTAGAAQTVCGCSIGVGDAFLTKLDASGSIAYSTYIGGTPGDSGSDVAVDAAGFAVVVGLTSAANFPVTPGALQTVYKGNSDMFAVKVNQSGSAFVYATYLGGSGFESAGAVAVDSLGNAFIKGATASTDFPATPGSFQSSKSTTDFDGFVTQISPTGNLFGWPVRSSGTYRQWT